MNFYYAICDALDHPNDTVLIDVGRGDNLVAYLQNSYAPYRFLFYQHPDDLLNDDMSIWDRHNRTWIYPRGRVDVSNMIFAFAKWLNDHHCL